MPEATFHFPQDFQWGVAVAAHQVEGNNDGNDWWAWEQEEGSVKGGHRSGLACNWWQDAEADFDRAAALGVDSLRLSVEWSRVEPHPGAFDEVALDRYVEMVRGLQGRGIEPMITLHHFTNPRWLSEQGGWESRETVRLFVRYVARVIQVLSPYCDLWCTINEPNVYAYQGYLAGIWPPGESSFGSAMTVIRNLLLGHAGAYRVIHDLQPGARVGFAHAMLVFDPPRDGSLLDRLATRLVDRSYNRTILATLRRGFWAPPLGFGPALKLRETLDWIGLNYYTRQRVAFDHTRAEDLYTRRFHEDDAELLDGGYGEFYPMGLLRCLERLAPFDLPIYITENGIPDDDDDQRPRHILTHLHLLWKAIQRSYPVMGYYHWTLVDNFEWAEGWTLRFGLIEVDPDTQARRPRRSAEVYGNLIRANAIFPRLIDEYAPELRPEIFPE